MRTTAKQKYSIVAGILTLGFGLCGGPLIAAMRPSPAAAQPPLARVFRETSKLSAAAGAPNDYFGAAVAISVNLAAVGIPGDDVGGRANRGSVQVFRRGASGYGSPVEIVNPSDGAGDQFGQSVALDGNTLAVGAPGYVGFGAVHIYVLNGSTWSWQRTVVASGGVRGDGFGSAVALQGDLLIVGAPDANRSAGAAYIFERNETSWRQRFGMSPDNPRAAAHFGRSVAIYGLTALVGAYYDGNDLDEEGEAYVYAITDRGLAKQAVLTSGDFLDRFGASVALSSDKALVGAAGARWGKGAAYLFTRTGGIWSRPQILTPDEADASFYFGQSVAIAGDTAVVGAPGGSTAIFVFRRGSEEWFRERKLAASDGAPFDNFGCAVGISGARIIAGANQKDISRNSQQGGAYIYEGRQPFIVRP